MDSYWSKVLDRRLSRRRALAASGSAALGAGVLAACGGDGAGDGDKGGLLTQPVDTTKQAKRGGIMKDRTFSDPPSLDPYTPIFPWNTVGPMAYSTLVMFKPGYLKPPEGEVIGDLAESWEWSPDGLAIVMKLRQGIKWHNKPPVNGRVFDVDDVLFAWDRFATKSTTRDGIVNAAHPAAPVLSLTPTDSKTIVLKLKEPLVYAPALFASNNSGGVLMLPKETDTTFDIRTDMIGTGPFVMLNYAPSVGYALKRHAEYYDKDYAFVDEVALPIVAEYAASVAQFKAANIYSFGSHATVPALNPEDIVPVKREEPRIVIYPGDLGTPRAFGARVMSFGWLPEGKSPFRDERVRQAISMAIDRDLWLDVVLNISRFAAEGLSVESRWNTALSATQEGWWLDPKGKDFGPNAKFFKHDLAEGKKLLAAAGYPNGFETISNYVTGPELPTAKHAEIMDGMISELGIRSRVSPVDYKKDYIPNYRDGKGQYEGWAYMSTAGGVTGGDPVGALANQFWSKGGANSFHGFSTSGKNDLSGDPQVDALIVKARVELDIEKRQGLVFDIQRHLAKAMYSLEPPGVGTGFTVAWPCLGNFRVYQGARHNYRLWVDETKPPFKSG